MAKTLGYMLTWRIYGTWVQGDERGYARRGKVYGKDERLKNVNLNRMRGEKVELTGEQIEVVREGILVEAERIRQRVYAMAVSCDHVHMVIDYIGRSVSELVACYKLAGRKAEIGWFFWTSLGERV